MQIQLRALEPEDIDLLYKWENDQTIWEVSNTIVPFSRYILSKYIESAHLDIYQAKQLRLMIDVMEDDVVKTIGSVDLFDFDPFHNRAGVGILIGETEERGRGYAAEALKKLITYAFNILNLHQLYCNITTSNTSSKALFEKCGFTRCGIKKDWIKTEQGFVNEEMYQLLNSLNNKV